MAICANCGKIFSKTLTRLEFNQEFKYDDYDHFTGGVSLCYDCCIEEAEDLARAGSEYEDTLESGWPD